MFKFGDCVWVLFGEYILVDGEIINNWVYIDEFMLMGEFLFVVKVIGDYVFVGILNGDELFDLCVIVLKVDLVIFNIVRL